MSNDGPHSDGKALEHLERATRITAISWTVKSQRSELANLSLKERHAALCWEQRVNEIKTTSAYKSIAQLIQQGQPISPSKILENVTKANEELNANPSEQTKTDETEKKHETQRRAPAAPDEHIKVTFAEAPPGEGAQKLSQPGEGSRRRCRRFPEEIRDAYKEMDMWYTPEDDERFETDFESLRALREVELTVERNNNKVTVARRKFPNRKTVPCAQPVKQQARALVPPKANSISRAQAKPQHNQSEVVATRQAAKEDPSPATQQDKPIMTKAKLQLLRGLLSEIMQSLPPAKRKKIDAALNEIDEGVGEQTTSEQREVVAKRKTTKDEAHSNPRDSPLVFTAAEKRRVAEFEWKKVTKGTKPLTHQKRRHHRLQPATVTKPYIPQKH